jgi:hypothetical protein
MTGTDDELLGRLRRIAAELDGPPEFVDATARAALSTRRIGDELARAVADSANVESATAIRDAERRIRLLTFQTATVLVELQVDEVGGRRSVRGQVAGAAGEVVVEAASETHHTTLDDRGWFTVDDLPAGVIRVRLRADDGTPVTTSWVS